MSHEKVLEVIKLKDSAPLQIDPLKTGLLIIDMQRYFVEPEHAFGQVLERMSPGVTADYFERMASTVVPNIQRLQAEFRAQGLPIFYTGTGSCKANRCDLAGWLQMFDAVSGMLLGKPVWPAVDDPAWAIHESVAPAPDETVVNKTSAGAFSTTELHRKFQQRGINTLVIAGTSTDVCVTTTARDAADLNYQVIVVEDACTTLSERMHEESLNAIRLAFGRTRNTEAVLKLLASSRQKAAAS
jgi:nicotinamidase-related amidase